jgi:hypothetical protein
MGLFGKRKERVIDLSEGYRRSSPRRAVKISSPRNEDNSSLGFLGNLAGSNSESSSSSDISWDSDSGSSQQVIPERKQKLARRLLEMTNKMEDMSNQIYHLNQRVELLEKKLKISFNN